jgi:uncharacterized protein HemX
VSGANWTSIAVAGLALIGVVFGNIVSSRANRRTAANSASLSTLEWAKEFEKRAQAAEAKAEEAETKNRDNERSIIALERKLARAETAADSLVDLLEWVGKVVELAHDPGDGDHAQLVRVINGGPPAYHRNK